MLSRNLEDNQSAHVAHIVLGRIVFNEKNIPAAVEHLISAGRVGTSPRLCSYGPMMKLAQELLESGRKGPVVAFLTDCKSFWDMGRENLSYWIQQIENGEIPTLEGDD